jgi:hypothetical protein
MPRMGSRSGPILAFGLCLAASAAQAQDAQLCLSAAELVKMGSKLSDADKRQAHDACLRALAESSNVVQKYHLQEADFDIMGTRPKQP